MVQNISVGMLIFSIVCSVEWEFVVDFVLHNDAISNEIDEFIQLISRLFYSEVLHWFY